MRKILLLLAAWLAAAAGVQAQDASSFPSKPLRMVVGFPPGGGTDIAARYAKIVKDIGLKLD